MFDDDADLSLVKWDHIWKLPSWPKKHEKLLPVIRRLWGHEREFCSRCWSE
jgi:hypothetical protein